MPLMDEEALETARSMHALAQPYRLENRLKELEDLILKALKVLEKILGENHRITLSNINDLALVYILGLP